MATKKKKTAEKLREALKDKDRNFFEKLAQGIDLGNIRKTYLGRKTENVFTRAYREVALFWDPTELTGPRSSGLPLLGLAQDGVKWTSNFADELMDRITGRQGVEDDPVEALYYSFKISPGLSAASKALEIYPQHRQSKT